MVALWLAALGLAWGQRDAIPTFGTTVVIPSGLCGRIYWLPEGTYMLPDFRRLRPVGTVWTPSLEVVPQDFSLGFPGVSKRFEWFAIDYTGRFWIETPGEYQFSLTSDDGSRLSIDGRVIISNDGQHAAETVFGRVRLSCGIHSIRVSYFQGPRFQVALVLTVAGPKQKWRLFSTDDFRPPPNPDDWGSCGGSGFRPLPAEERLKLRDSVAEAMAMDVLSARPRPRAFEFRSAAFLFGQESGVLAFEVPGGTLAATQDPKRSVHRLHVSLLALVRRADGQVVDTFRLDAPYEIADAQIAAVRATPLTYTHPLKLAPGRYTVETAILDRVGDRASVGEMPIEVAGPPQGIALSSPILTQQFEPASAGADPLVFEGRRVVPLLDPVLKPDAKAHVYFVIYPDRTRAGKPALEVEFRVGGKLLARQTAELPPAGSIPLMIEAATPKGDCELKITAVQGTGSASAVVSYAVH